MHTLSIPQIFARLSYYKQHYLDILQDSSQYYTLVENARIDLWPCPAQQLYLGDLLQLWFSEKWEVEQEQPSGFEIFLESPENPAPEKQFVYVIKGNLLTGKNQSSLWQTDSVQTLTYSLAHVSKYYFEFKALTRPVLKTSLSSLQHSRS